MRQRDIGKDEILTFFYPQTEWHMEAAFEWHCNTPRCIGTIRGADELTAEQLLPYQSSPHILRLMNARDA